MFSTSLYFYHPFIIGVLHGGSTWWVVKDLIPFSKFSSRFFPKELKLSSYGNPECNSFYHIFGRGIMSFLIIWVHVPWFTCCHEWDILNPSISSLELSWVIFHLKLSFKDCRSYGVYQWSKFFIYPPGEIASRLLVLINPIVFPVSGRLSPHNLRCIP